VFSRDVLGEFPLWRSPETSPLLESSSLRVLLELRSSLHTMDCVLVCEARRPLLWSVGRLPRAASVLRQFLSVGIGSLERHHARDHVVPAPHPAHHTNAVHLLGERIRDDAAIAILHYGTPQIETRRGEGAWGPGEGRICVVGSSLCVCACCRMAPS